MPVAVPCPICHHTHSPRASVVTIGRFSIAPRYVAKFDGAPRRATRAEAHQDMCDHYARAV